MNAQEIPKTYNAKDWEDKLYHAWEESGFFNPDECIKAGITKVDAASFSIVLPPPNVTGTLHTGSACMLAIEDLIVRFKRMQGYRTLWLPGTDHAAIATQSKVERIIYEKEKKTRHDLGRKELLERIESFAEESRATIIHQTKKMGSSLDWSREAYTLDEKRNFAVRTAFKKMYDDEIIYRGERIVNWDPKMQTTVSDDEIEYVEQNSPFYYFQYGPFVIGTVRPETKFGDKYVVMHPDDERYKEYKHRQKIDLEWINGPITATVIKDTAGDMTFGSGVMTITPAHSRVDFEIAQKHGLDIEPVINDQGILLSIAGEFAGQEIKEARGKIIEKIKAKGLLVKIDEQYTHNIATNSRGGGTIEPQIKKQWWINVNKEFQRDGKMVTLKSLMQNAVQSDGIKIIPERFEKTYFHWINNLRDWCISRQIWYGHRIPVWYRPKADQPRAGSEDMEIYCGVEAPVGEGWEQDPDTLDTWFSSGLWTFSTLGWPTFAETAEPGQPGPENDFANYHPTALLETAYDILFFWVARMILMTTYLLDTVPFKTVYLHGLVRDEQGRKMSKSLDIITDPLDMIADYGADALRLALVIGSSPGNDARIGNEKIISFRNFTNKLWNIGRYVSQQPTKNSQLEMKSNADHWILRQLQDVTAEVTRLIENYQFSLAGEKLRDFTWNEFADWYVEIHKVEKNDAVLHLVFETLLKLWHPFMPFVTEAIFQTSQSEKKSLLIIATWPKNISLEAKAPLADYFQSIIGLIQEMRAIKSLYRINPVTKLNITACGESKQIIQNNAALFKRLARINEIHYSETVPSHTALAQFGSLQIFIELESVIDFDTEKKRLGKEIAEKEKYISSLETKLSNKNFIGLANPEVVETERLKLDEAKKHLADFKHHLTSLS